MAESMIERFITDFETLSVSENDSKGSTKKSSSLCSSKIGQDDIDHMFVKGSLELRNMETSPSGGTRIKGTKWDVILDNLLKDLNASEKEHQFSVSSYEELVSLQLLEKVPEEVQGKCDLIEKEHEQLFQTTLEDRAYDTLPVFRSILAKAQTSYLSTEDSSQKQGKREYLIAMKNVLRLILDIRIWQITSSKEILHRGWAELYRTIFSAIIQGDQKFSEGRRDVIKTGNLLYNGLASFRLLCEDPVHTGKNEPKEKSHPTTKQERNKYPVFITIIPDMLPLVENLTFDGSEYLSFTEIPAFVVEVKTSSTRLFNWPGWWCPSVHDYGKKVCRSDEERIRIEYTELRHHINTAMAKLKSQHFLQLLALMKNPSPNNARKRLKTSYGLYIFMNRVYVTHLSFDRSLPKYQTEENLLIAANEAGKGKYADEDVYMQMFCSDFFDIFNVEHFKAFMAFLKILFWHEQEKNIFQIEH